MIVIVIVIVMSSLFGSVVAPSTAEEDTNLITASGDGKLEVVMAMVAAGQNGVCVCVCVHCLVCCVLCAVCCVLELRGLVLCKVSRQQHTVWQVMCCLHSLVGLR